MTLCNVCSAVAPDGVDTCPYCEAKERQRAIKWLLDTHLQGQLDLPNRRLLACHLVRSERLIFRSAREIVNFDVRPLPGLDLVMDFQDMSQIESASFDGVLSIHVFNHIPDDRKAIEEIKRILKPGGFLLSTVGYDAFGPTRKWDNVTEHYGTENMEKFGVGTYRKYGVLDFLGLLNEFFETQVFDALDPWTDRSSKVFISIHNGDGVEVSPNE